MYLQVLGKLDKNLEHKIRDKHKLDPDLKFFLTGFSDFDVPKNYKFNKLAKTLVDAHFTELNVQLIFITQTYFIELDFIEKGWRNIVGLMFKNKEPVLFSNLPILDSWNSPNEKSIYLFGE